MSEHRTVTFLRTVPPNGPGDVAGVPAARAQLLVDRGHAIFLDIPPEPPIDFGAMSREELLGHAATVLGLTEAPPEDVTDDELRAALQAHADGMPVPPPADEPPPAVDQIDALDRAHLEAFARSKLGLTEIDPALSDEDLRKAVRTLAEEASVSHVSSVTAVARKTGKRA